MKPLSQLEKAIEASNSRWCLECGKCTANCPIARFDGGYSPRRMMGMALTGSNDDLLADATQWSCLACGMCEVRCPADVAFTELLRQVRARALPERTSWPECTHGGTLHACMRQMTDVDLQQRRLDWIDDDLQVAETGDVLLFVGCAPYYDAYFSYLGVSTLASARGAIKILNRLGIQPVLMKDERCCGHDMLWMGDEETYRELGERNLEAIEATGAKTVITTCAECYRTLKLDYPEHFDAPAWKVRHMSEVIAEAAAAGELEFAGDEATVTYQDPCRLGRHSGVYDEPRAVLGKIPGLRLVEMDRNRQRSLCCGTSAWINCDQTSKRIQAARLESAKATGAETLVTCCPKCLIHFKCALQDESLATAAGIEIRDLTVLAAETMAEV